MKKQIFRYFSYTSIEQSNKANTEISRLLDEGWLVKISYPMVYGTDNRYQALIFIFERDESVTPSIQ